MALSAWQATIVNESGDVIPSAQVQVIDDATGLNADIFANSGGTTAANPFTATAGGFAQFYANAGTYRVIASDSGTGFSETWEDQRLGDAQARDTGTGADQVPTNGDLPTFGTAAEADTGTGAGQVPTNADLGTAAQADTGTAPSEVPTNADLGTAAQVDTGTAPSEVPTNADLGTAAQVDTGLATGQVPTADQLSMVGETVNYTGANLNIDTFGGIAAGNDIARGNSTSATTAAFYLPLNSVSAPFGISVTGTFSILNVAGTITTGVSSFSLISRSNNKMAVLTCAITGGTAGENISLRTETSSSKIVVNF